jgi:hypothetical protein
MRPRAALPLLLPLAGTLCLLALLALPGLSADKPTPAELKEKVKNLVAQLADKSPDKQDEAAAELLRLGPDALPYLPKPDAKLPEGQKRALAVVRKTLRDQQIERDLAPKRVTIDDELPVSKMLAELTKQTGIAVEDRREGTDAKIKLKLNKVTFWQALDAIAKEADGVVSLYERDGVLALGPRREGYTTAPVSYDGIFRATVRRITAQRLLESENSTYVADVEVAWEPRFRPFRLDLNLDDITVQDDKGRKIAIAEDGREDPRRDPRRDSRAIASKRGVVFDVPLGSVQRSSPKLGLLKGSIKFVGPTHGQLRLRQDAGRDQEGPQGGRADAGGRDGQGEQPGPGEGPLDRGDVAGVPGGRPAVRELRVVAGVQRDPAQEQGRWHLPVQRRLQHRLRGQPGAHRVQLHRLDQG